MPVVGDGLEVGEGDDAVAVEIGLAPVGGGLLPVVGEVLKVFDVDDAVEVGVAFEGGGDEDGAGVDVVCAAKVGEVGDEVVGDDEGLVWGDGVTEDAVVVGAAEGDLVLEGVESVGVVGGVFDDEVVVGRC